MFDEEKKFTNTLKESDLMIPSLHKTENGISIFIMCKEEAINNAKAEASKIANQEFDKLQETFDKIKKAFSKFLS
mgnify:CR=1 FL=1